MEEQWKYVLPVNIHFNISINGNIIEISINKGFKFDGDSGPFVKDIWSVWKKMDSQQGLWASCIHDYLYLMQFTTRKEADEIYFRFLSEFKHLIRSHIRYFALRTFGGFAWRRHSIMQNSPHWNKYIKERFTDYQNINTWFASDIPTLKPKCII